MLDRLVEASQKGKGWVFKSELLAITENISMQCVNATNHAASPVAPGGIITVRANQTLVEEINV